MSAMYAPIDEFAAVLGWVLNQRPDSPYSRYSIFRVGFEDPELLGSTFGAADAMQRLNQFGRTLAATCESAGFSVDDVVAAIEDVLEAEEPKACDWDAMSMAALCDQINATHHDYTRGAFVHLTPLVAKVLNVHGERHRELSDVQRLFEALAADLLPHLAKEERVLFPSIAAIEADPNHPMARCFAGPLAVMRSEHETVGKLLHDMRSVTRGYQPPPGACTSFRVLYAGLASLAADLHTHIHLENNVLFPRVEARLANAATPASHADV